MLFTADNVDTVRNCAVGGFTSSNYLSMAASGRLHRNNASDDANYAQDTDSPDKVDFVITAGTDWVDGATLHATNSNLRAVASGALDGAGLHIASITTDQEGDTRANPPFIGADEIVAAGGDVDLTKLVGFGGLTGSSRLVGIGGGLVA